MLKWSNCLLVLFCLRYSVAESQISDNGAIKPIVVSNATVGQNYSYSVNSQVEYLFQYKNLQFGLPGPAYEFHPPRVTIECLNATRRNPVLVVLRQAKGVLSWQLPLMVPTRDGKVGYNRTSRTLCPNSNYQQSVGLSVNGKNGSLLFEGLKGFGEQVDIIISSSSAENLTFFLRLEVEKDFVVNIAENRTLTVNPSEPKFYEFKWDTQDPADSVAILKVESEDDVCMVVSIQNISCPVFDLERTVQFEGHRQTVTKLGGITLTRSHFPNGFYVVFVVKGDDFDCSNGVLPVNERSKTVSFSFKRSIGYDDYLKATAAAFFLYASMYLVAIVVCIIYYTRKRETPDFLNDIHYVTSSVPRSRAPSCSGSMEGRLAEGSRRRCDVIENSLDSSLDDISLDLDDDDVDTLSDRFINKDVIRSKKDLCVSDLARKNPRILRKKSLMYFWNLLTVATFYALPVVQLVLSSQKVLQQTGNQDLCYYNFLCAYPLGPLSDFNHVFSNIGYFLLGLLFVFLVYRRDRMHCNAAAEIHELDMMYGIPQHYGLLYAMGAALMMEGILSGCYHVCPNHSNFQFDTSFMYVIAILCMLKIYHSRHPDINASAYATFGVLALVILVGVTGILSGAVAPYFWSTFTVIHLLTCLWLSSKVYYMGRLQLGFSIFRRAWNLCRREVIPNPLAFFKPRYPSRMVLLILGNMANWALAAVAWIYNLESNFGSYLLAIFMANLMLYTVFYIVMKILCYERLLLQPIVYLILATCGWGLSLDFFFHKSISWAVTPAQSRSFNQPCLLMDFYDRHDVWHFLSAFSMFFSFMTLLTLDDDLVHEPRSNISVF